jgi:hypothetical protein
LPNGPKKNTKKEEEEEQLISAMEEFGDGIGGVKHLIFQFPIEA